MNQNHQEIVGFIKDLFKQDFVPLHEPRFVGNEKDYLARCIDSTFVSYVGEFVKRFEEEFKTYVGSKHSISTVNGTAALHMALHALGVDAACEVIAPVTTFVATINAIKYTGADPVFVDSERDTFGIDPVKMEEFLAKETVTKDDGLCYNRTTGRRVAACVVVHVFGHPARVDLISQVCKKYNIVMIEDAAESLGSYYQGRHTGTFAKVSIFSFNGNKILTTGGGGMIVTDDAVLAEKIRHMTTTAKQPHKWEYVHDQVGYNYRMPNINAAVGLAQLEKLPMFIDKKRELAGMYKKFFDKLGVEFFVEKKDSRSNYWLNAIVCKDRSERDSLLEHTNSNGVMTRPIWRLMNELNMYKGCQKGDLSNARWLEDRVVNIPSSVRL